MEGGCEVSVGRGVGGLWFPTVCRTEVGGILPWCVYISVSAECESGLGLGCAPGEHTHQQVHGEYVGGCECVGMPGHLGCQSRKDNNNKSNNSEDNDNS